MKQVTRPLFLPVAFEDAVVLATFACLLASSISLDFG